MITMSTPYQEMHSIFWQEYEKCEYWVQKDISRRGKQFKKDTAYKHRMGQDPELPSVEYKGKTGNRWVNNLYVSAATLGGVVIGYDTVCYWETLGSFGAFMPFSFGGERYLIITPGHFWQRVCERTDYKMQGVHTAMQFLREHLSSRKEILPPSEKDTRRQIAIHWNGGSGYGVEVCPELRIFELRTFINEDSMTGKKLYNRRKQTKGMKSEEVKSAIDQMKALTCLSPNADMSYVMNNMDGDKREVLGDDIRLEEVKQTDERLAELIASGMTEDEAIKAMVEENHTIAYQTKYGGFVTEDSKELSELRIRMRETEMYRRRKASCKEMIRAMKEHLGVVMPDSTQRVFYDVFTTCYRHAWVTVHNWFMSEYTTPDCEPIQPYKHRIFVDVVEDVRRWAKEQGFNEEQQEGAAYFATIGFDRGFGEAFDIAAKLFNLPICVNRTTSVEYLKKVCSLPE